MKIAEIEVKDELINNALIGAREGGTNYWAKSRLWSEDTTSYREGNKKNPVRLPVYVTKGKQRGEKLLVNTEYPNCFQSFYEEEKLKVELFITHEALQRGLKLMAEKYPKHFADLIGENDDATTHDAMVQCALLGDIIYG